LKPKNKKENTMFLIVTMILLIDVVLYLLLDKWFNFYYVDKKIKEFKEAQGKINNIFENELFPPAIINDMIKHDSLVREFMKVCKRERKFNKLDELYKNRVIYKTWFEEFAQRVGLLYEHLGVELERTPDVPFTEGKYIIKKAVKKSK
jgi:hypothetical protein